MDLFFPKTAEELTNYIRGVIHGEISLGRVAQGPRYTVRPSDCDPTETKSFEQLIAEVGGWEPPQATFDAEAATLNDGADEEISVWLALQYVAPHVSRAGEAAWNKLRTAIDVADSRAQKPWRLPTLEECAGDPEATRVWNAVNKPALEWRKTAEVGPPAVIGKVDSREWLASLNRHIWAAAEGGTVAWLSTAAAIRTSVACKQKVPDYWMEADTPKPPSVPMSNAELHNEFE